MANIAIDWEKYEEDLSRVFSQPQAGQWSTVISLTGQKYEGYYLGVTNDQIILMGEKMPPGVPEENRKFRDMIQIPLDRIEAIIHHSFINEDDLGLPE